MDSKDKFLLFRDYVQKNYDFERRNVDQSDDILQRIMTIMKEDPELRNGHLQDCLAQIWNIF